MLQLRPYQAAGVNAIRQSYQRGHSAPLYVLSTGGGKTVVFCHIGHSVATRGKRVLILVHRIELLRQTGLALQKNGVSHGLINPKYTPDYSRHVQVASVQTLINRLDKIPAPDLIIIDEAHHANAGTWKRILNHWPNAYKLGVTATPVRGDGAGLGVQCGGLFDDLIVGPSIQDLIAGGYLVKPIVYAPLDRLDLKGVKVVRGDYDKKEVESRVDKPKITGDAVSHYQRLCPGVPAVAFCISIGHAEHVAAAFRAAGFRAYSADGTMDDETRTRILNGLGNGTVDIVCSCDLISEGTDIPAIGAAILLRPTKSEGLYIQQVGRALRPMPGKEHAIILDHVGNTLIHDVPHANREWTLDGETKRRKSKSEKDKAPIVKQCPVCYAMHEPLAHCPQCGYRYEVDNKIKVEDGELQIMSAQEEAIIKRNRGIEVGKANSLEELIEIGRKRGYKPGWAHAIYAAKQAKQNKLNEPAKEAAPDLNLKFEL